MKFRLYIISYKTHKEIQTPSNFVRLNNLVTIFEMEQKLFCLKWSNYLDVFHGALLPLLNSEHFTDVTLSCDSQSIKCHRLVLSSCSSYFETLLVEISHPHPVIILKDVKFHDLLALVKFMYTGEVTVPQAQTSSLIKVAEMLKVKGLAYPDETVNQIQKPSCLAQNTQMTQPAVRRNRVDTTFEDNLLAGDFSSNLEPPLAENSNDKLVNYPDEASFSVYQTDMAACNPLLIKDEFAVGIDKGWGNSPGQFEVDGECFDNGSEKLFGNQILERTERKPEVEEPIPDFSEGIFGRKYPILSPKHEDVPLVVSPAVSEQLNRNLKSSELESNIRENEEVEDALPSHNEMVFGAQNLLLFPKREDVPLGNFPGFSGSLKLQLNTQESGDKAFDCQGVANTSPSNTNTPLEAVNSNIGFNKKKCRKDYACNICSKRFHFHSTLERHQRIHTGKKTFKCDICQKSFSQSYSLNLHQRVHTGEKPYKCDVCEKSFCDSSALSKHQTVHTGEKQFKCDICHKSFSRSYSLNIHQRLHTGEKPYKCDLCQMNFSRLDSLNIHRRLHTGEKPYKCDVCEKSYCNSSGLNRHQRVHSGEKPIKCDLCKKCFYDSSHYHRHQKLHKRAFSI